jgi:chromosome partitioning protein
LGTQLAIAGASVTMIDADPNHPLATWAKRPGKPEGLTVVSDVNERTIIDEIETAGREDSLCYRGRRRHSQHDVAYAISRADLVIVPVQGSQLDAAEAAKAIKLIRQQEKAFGRRIPYAVLLTRTSAAIQPRTLRHIRAELEGAAVPIPPNADARA